MNTEELEDAVFRYGADFERWPPDMRIAAAKLIAEDPAAARVHAELVSFERSITAAVQAPPFGAAEIGGVLAALDRKDGTAWPTRHFWLAGAGASAFSFAAGFALTLLLSVRGSELEALVALMGLAAGQSDIGGLL